MSINSALSHQQCQGLMDCVVKQSILGILITVISGGFPISIFVVETFNAETDRDLMIVYIVRGMEGLLIMVLSYLGLAVNDRTYRRICKFCHKRCHRCAVDKFKQKVSTRYYSMDALMPQ